MSTKIDVYEKALKEIAELEKLAYSKSKGWTKLWLREQFRGCTQVAKEALNSLTHNQPVECPEKDPVLCKDCKITDCDKFYPAIEDSVACEHGVTPPAYCELCAVPFKRKEKIVIKKLMDRYTNTDSLVVDKINEIIDAINPTYEISEEVLAGWIREWFGGDYNLMKINYASLAKFLKNKGIK